MRQVALVVEGQTEEQFVQHVLSACVPSDVYLTPLIVRTGRTARGVAKGGGHWKHYRPKIHNLLREPHWDVVTTMIDYYGYPGDAPGRGVPAGKSLQERVESRERAMAEDLGAESDERFLPFVMLHEFETLVLTACTQLPDVFGDPAVPRSARRVLSQFDDEPERINEGPATAPARRVEKLLPGYSKPQDGVAILAEADMDEVMKLCPHFARWVTKLRELSVHARGSASE